MANWFLKIGNSRMVAWNGSKKYLDFPSSQEGIRALLKKIKGGDQVYVLNVVPLMSKKLNQAARVKKIALFNISIKDIPLKPAYTKNLGVDRLMNVFSASFLTHKNIVVIDLGTALTVDFLLNKKSKHLGGWIFIGTDLALRSLGIAAAQLPHLIPRSISKTFGGSTSESLQIGQTAYLRAIIGEAKIIASKVFGRNYEIFVTGGGARLVPKSLARRIDYLSLRGLKKLAQMKKSWRGRNFKN